MGLTPVEFEQENVEVKDDFAGFGFEDSEGEAIEDDNLLVDDLMGEEDDFFGDDE